MSDWITIRHPDIADTAQVTEQSYRQVWKPRGWQEADPAAEAASEILGRPVDDITSLPKADVETVAEQLGADTSGNPTKADLLDSIAATQAVEAPPAPPTPDNPGQTPEEG